MANFTTDGKICIERDLPCIMPNTIVENFIEYFDVTKTCKWIRDNNYSKVCLQFPDELLNISATIYHEIKQRTNVDLYILGDTSYGSCCVDSVAAMHVEGNAIVHYGHACFSKTNIPVFYVLPKKEINLNHALKQIQNKFKNVEPLCLFYDAEFEHVKDKLSQYWYECYPNSFVASIQVEDKEERYLGRIIKDKNNCEHPVDVLKDLICIHIGTRGQTLFNFTVSLEAKEWFNFDPDTSNLDRLEETTWFKRRRFLIEKCKDAKTVGILVCKLAGDQTKDIITRMKQLCKINGKKSYIVSVGKPNVAKLANFPEIDIYVMIACPESDLYNNREFYQPIVYPYELDVALNSNRDPYFTHHVTDFDDLLPGKRHYCELDHIKGETDVSLITGKIRETNINISNNKSKDVVEIQNMALECIGQNLQDRSWKGLEQKLGESEAKTAEVGRSGIPLNYKSEPK